jgi:PIN domain nuclease of toxin-antitoxin system
LIFVILLDTHVVIWLAQDYQRISPTAQSKIEDARRTNRGLAVSDITLLEIARLGSHGQINLIPDAETVLAPADRIIAATALVEDIPLLTADREIRRSRAVPTIW